MTRGVSVTRDAEDRTDLRNLLRPLSEARRRLRLAPIRPVRSVTLPLVGAVGRISADDVRTRHPEPSVDLAAMDGFAIGLPRDGRATSFRLRDGFLTPGARPGQLRPGEAIAIGTGAPLPAGAGAVVRRERARAGPAEISVHRVPAPGTDVHRRGEDLPAGARILTAGEQVRPYQLGLLLAQHVNALRVRVPRITIIVTGDEFGGRGRTGARVVRDSISPMIGALAERLGTVRRERVSDRLEALTKALVRVSRTADLIVTIGGTSVGSHDVTKQAIRRVGALWFEGVRTNVLKRAAAGRVERTPVVVLPGQVVAAVVAGHEFGRAALARLTGWTPPPPIVVPLREELRNPQPMDSVYLFRLGPDGARPCRWGVRLYSELLSADAYGIVPRASRLPAGAPVALVPLDGAPGRSPA